MYVIWDFSMHRLPKSYRKEAPLYERLRFMWDRCPRCKKRGLPSDYGESFCIDHGSYWWFSGGKGASSLRAYNGPEGP